MRKTVAIAFLALIVSVAFLAARCHSLGIEYENAVANVKAYQNENSRIYRKVIAMNMTIDELEYSSDSLMQKLDSVRKALKIRDKNLKTLQYNERVIKVTDTLVLGDIVFSEGFDKDTAMTSEWYDVNIHMSYPDTLTAAVTMISRGYVVTSLKKETVKPPRKFFLFRLFQKKHKVLTVDYIEENPYIKQTRQRYIEIKD